MFGRKFFEEIKRKIGEKLKGRFSVMVCQIEEVKRKILKVFKGKK